MQTVRASFSVPGQGGATALDELKESGEEERRGRGLKPMRYVSKASLIRKEQSAPGLEEEIADSPETEATVREMANPSAAKQEARSDAREGFPYLKNISPVIRDDYNSSDSSNGARPLNGKVEKNIKYAKFLLDHSFQVVEKDFAAEVSTKGGNFPFPLSN